MTSFIIRLIDKNGLSYLFWTLPGCTYSALLICRHPKQTHVPFSPCTLQTWCCIWRNTNLAWLYFLTRITVKIHIVGVLMNVQSVYKTLAPSLIQGYKLLYDWSSWWPCTPHGRPRKNPSRDNFGFERNRRLGWCTSVHPTARQHHSLWAIVWAALRWDSLTKKTVSVLHSHRWIADKILWHDIWGKTPSHHASKQYNQRKSVTVAATALCHEVKEITFKTILRNSIPNLAYWLCLCKIPSIPLLYLLWLRAAGSGGRFDRLTTSSDQYNTRKGTRLRLQESSVEDLPCWW